jgi:hypothetical protein
VAVPQPVSVVFTDNIGRVMGGIDKVSRYAHMKPDFFLNQYGRLGVFGFVAPSERTLGRR